MNIEWNLKTIIIAAAIAIILIGTNVGQYFMIWGPKQRALTASYDKELGALKAKINKIGPMVEVWTVKDGVEGLFPGKQIDPNDLDMKQIPESFINQSFILDPETVIGKYYRVGLTSGTPLSKDLVMEDPLDDTIREYDVVASVMPIGLKVGDYVDFRIVYPLGEDYIVLPRKRVEAINDKTIKFKLNEQEIHFYQAALIDYFLQVRNGSTLYLTKYLEPGIQKAATQYYSVPKNILAIMIADPNIVQKINAQLNNTSRTMIDAGIAGVSPEVGQAISSGRNEIIGKIDSGSTQLKNDEKARQDAEAQADAQAKAGLPAPKPSSSPSATSTPTSNSTNSGSTGNKPPSSNSTNSTSSNEQKKNTAPGAPLLNIEKGVVE
ncbi:hypothetical protein QFZ81_000132 [Paenibacillus sp. V4I9]|uniref:SAF domain-containing protein n=1 Tax=Paenibacillus sp. V4I9 TaxID=3042308 RepID=UPI002787EE76|nr:SAF domain-containing protein [Paenibacillus sp. V4I9]MDQ0885044.1 hypothetical protein [Paenibacillus sp. V4I9]